jgi:O-antigen/teichoic acid export membrane protein
MGAFGTLANQLDKILVFHYLGATELAVYAFSQAIPDQARGALKSLFGIALPKYADMPHDQLRKSVVKKSIQLTLFTIFAVVVYLGLAPYIFETLFPKYLEAILYSQIYMLGMITIPGITLFTTYFQLKKATRKLYELNIISTISTLLITFILVYKHGLMGAVIANGTSWLVMLLVHWFYFMKEKDLEKSLS